MAKPDPRAPATREHAAALFLDQYFPFHYEVGFMVERHLRDARLTQQQSIILWIIHSSGVEGRTLPRKDIERRLKVWFDVTNSAVSKALRGMARPPLELIAIEEHPASGREKIVRLTRAGDMAIVGMMARGERVIQRMVEEMDDAEIQQGLHFLRNVSAIVSRWSDEDLPATLQASGEEVL